MVLILLMLNQYICISFCSIFLYAQICNVEEMHSHQSSVMS